MKFIPDAPNVEGANERAGTRTPMQWEAGATAGFSTCTPDKLYLPVSTDGGRITVAAEEKDRASMLNFVRALISLRQQTPALGNTAAWALLSGKDKPYPMVYQRSLDGQVYVVALNPSEKAVKATIPTQGGRAKAVMVSGKARYNCKAAIDVLTLSPFSAAVFYIKR